MIDEKTIEQLFSIAEKELRPNLSDRQKKALIGIHEWYFIRLNEKPHITAPELREKCFDIVRASEKFLKAIKKPLPIGYGDELLHGEIVDCVKAYQGLAQKWLEHFEPSTMKKRWAEEGKIYKGPRGRPRNWPVHMYVRDMAGWYEDVKEKKPSGGSGSIFPRFIRLCFKQIVPNSRLSDKGIRRALESYKVS